MSTREMDAQVKAKNEAQELLKNAREHADQVYKEAKKQADIVYKGAKKIAADKHAKKAADKAHKEALEQVKKVRDAITAEALSVFTTTWEQSGKDYDEAIVA